MSWENYRRRARVLDGVLDDVVLDNTVLANTGLDDVGAHGGWRVPDRWRPEVDAMFGGEAGFARALYPRWFAALTARLDEVLQARPADLPEAAARAARQLARERPALYAPLAAYVGHPVMRAVRERERRDLGWAPGAQLTALAARPEAVAA